MRLRTLAAGITAQLALMASAVTAAPDTPANPPPASPPAGPMVASTRQHAFTIPFRIEAAASAQEQPVEVQLHVSTDDGAKWDIAARVPPEKGAFVFRAPRDGHYWYSIRTVDKQGVVRPDGPLSPQLKVNVDTVAPRLELSAVRGPAGEIIAHWQAVDPNLKQGSFKLEYQASSSDPWERVAAEPPPAAMRHTFSSQATWWPRTNSSLLVRAEITDEAGNPAVSQAVVKAGDTVSAVEASRAPGTEGSVVSSLAGASSTSNTPATNTASMNAPALNPPATDSTRWAPDRSTSEPLGHAPSTDSHGSDAATRDSNWRTTARPASLPMQGARGGAATDAAGMPQGQRPRMVNARAFELEYEVDSVGPSGIGKVELWGTRDGGRSWSIYGVDSDNRSPIGATVDGEGIYGFRVVVQSGNGLGGRPPADGDTPDIWLGIDLTKPTARITSAEVAAEGGELAIGWEAGDATLDTRPVSLAFSPNAQGPWTPIASGLENTGSYRWRLDNRVPDRIYLRLEVRDEAGNVGAFETTDAVSLDRHRPEGRIRGVRPLGQ